MMEAVLYLLWSDRGALPPRDAPPGSAGPHSSPPLRHLRLAPD